MTLRYRFPDGWTDELRAALISGSPHRGVVYTLLVDGEEVEHARGNLYLEAASDFRTGTVVLNIPLTADAQTAIESVALRLAVSHYACVTADGVTVSDLSSPFAIRHGDSLESDGVTIAIPDCDIPIL